MERPPGTPRRQDAPDSDGMADTPRPTATGPQTPRHDHDTTGTPTPGTPGHPPNAGHDPLRYDRDKWPDDRAAAGPKDDPVSTPSVVGSDEPAADPMRNRPIPDHPGNPDADRAAVEREASDRRMQHARPETPDSAAHDRPAAQDQSAKDRAAFESPGAPRMPRLMSTSPGGPPPESAGRSLWITLAGIVVVLLLLMLIF